MRSLGRKGTQLIVHSLNSHHTPAASNHRFHKKAYFPSLHAVLLQPATTPFFGQGSKDCTVTARWCWYCYVATQRSVGQLLWFCSSITAKVAQT